MTTLELHYWPIRGIAAAPRLALTIAGADFRDVHVTTISGWKQTRDASEHPFLNLPFLVVKDAKSSKRQRDADNAEEGETQEMVITQSNAILRFIARRFHDALGAESEVEKARVDELLETLADYKKEYITLSYQGPRGDAEGLAKHFESFDKNSVPYYFGGFEKYITRSHSKSPFASGAVKPTVADCLLWSDLEAYLVFKKAPVEEALSAYPRLLAFHAAMMAIPAVAAFAKSEANALPCNGFSGLWSAMEKPSE